MSIIKTLEALGNDPSLSADNLTSQQRQEIEQLKQHAKFVNANMMIGEPDTPDEDPEPNKNPDDR